MAPQAPPPAIHYNVASTTSMLPLVIQLPTVLMHHNGVVTHVVAYAMPIATNLQAWVLVNTITPTHLPHEQNVKTLSVSDTQLPLVVCQQMVLLLVVTAKNVDNITHSLLLLPTPLVTWPLL